MKQYLTILLSLICTLASAQYRPDILGADFESLTMSMTPDEEGSVECTLVRRTPLEGVDRAVLYVHGYNDYFFQEEMASRFAAEGWQFYAVDLRRYGRSMREWQTPFAVDDVEEYFEDIDSAIDVMQSEGVKHITLMAHSTGGLITSLYCDENKDDLRVEALLLNSPFFDMNMSWMLESVATPVISFLGRWFKGIKVQSASDEVSNYSRSLLSEYSGEWEYDTSLKFSCSLDITSGWIRAIHRAQRRLQRGLEIPCPVLVMYSARSVWGDWCAEYLAADSVLDVEDIDKYSDGLGTEVSEVAFEGGLHDLVLSRKEVREEVYFTMFEWLDGLEK